MVKNKKENKNIKKKKKVEFNAQFWMSISLLVIMVLSIAGFAMLSAGPTRNSDGKYTQDIPLQYFDQYGVWATVKNGEQFIFDDINKYEQMTYLGDLSNQIKNNELIYLDYPENYDPSSIILLEKALKASRIKYIEIGNESNFNCNSSTLVLTYNDSNLIGNCMRLVSKSNESYEMTKALVYYLVK